MKLEQKLKARELRRQGLSITEIERRIGSPRSSVLNWVRDIPLTSEQYQQLSQNSASGLNKVRHEVNQRARHKRLQHRSELMIEAGARINALTKYDRLVLGATLYWAEGSKTMRSFQFTNSDPAMIQFMIQWLQEQFGVTIDKIRLMLNIHENLDCEQIKQYWSNLTGVPISQFYKTQIKKSTLSHQLLYRGTVGIYVNNADLFYKIEGLIEKLKVNMGVVRDEYVTRM